MTMENFTHKTFNELSKESQKEISGGVAWWIPIAAGILYQEVSDAWKDGGKAIKEAYEAGYEDAYSAPDA